MANITLMGASYTDVPAIDLPKTGGGTVRFYENGGTPSATQHVIEFELENSTVTINAYYDSAWISDAITATTPTEYNGQTVVSASLDGVAWYETSGDVPLNTELVDYSAVRTGFYVDDNNGTIIAGESWDCVTDYIPIGPSMTFSFKSRAWYCIGFFDSSKTPVGVYMSNDLGTASGEVVTGTITPSVIPSNAAYIVLTGNPYQLTASALSLIRTA